MRCCYGGRGAIASATETRWGMRPLCCVTGLIWALGWGYARGTLHSLLARYWPIHFNAECTAKGEPERRVGTGRLLAAGEVGLSCRRRLAACHWAWLIREPPEIDVRRNLTRKRGHLHAATRSDIHAPALLLWQSDNRAGSARAVSICSQHFLFFSASLLCTFSSCNTRK